jgi:ABC-2 type transport system permease protein
MSFTALFNANLKILYRNWRALFFNLALPVAIYTFIGLLHIRRFGGIRIDYSTYLLPGIIAMTIMQTGIFTLAYWLIDMRERGVIKRFMVTPLSTWELIASLVCTRLLLMVVQVALLVFIGTHYFGAVARGNYMNIAVTCLLGGIVFLNVGFLISNFARNYEEASPITTAVNLTFTLLGNVFVPAEVFPKFLQAIAAYLPITYLAVGLRENFTSVGVGASVDDMLGLLAWAVVLVAVNVWMFNARREQ